eukprot:jgi/Bigna1/72972/fgenesh1_pg.22_\
MSRNLRVLAGKLHPSSVIRRISQKYRRSLSSSAQLLPNAHFQRIIERFPPCEFSCAYGSGVFRQIGYEGNGKEGSDEDAPLPMLDLILGVEDSEQWHGDNLRRNPGDYSWPLSWLPPSASKTIQETGGAHMLYHPYVDVDILPTEKKIESNTGLRTEQRQQIKYGVISMKHLQSDLLHWDTLFCAGRLHKPVVLINSNPMIEELLLKNHKAALTCALLMLPAVFTEEELFYTLAGLSYSGDPRFLLGAENSSKVENIVNANLEGFRAIYRPLIDDIDFIRLKSRSQEVEVEGGQQEETSEAATTFVRLPMETVDVKNIVERHLPSELRRRINVTSEMINSFAHHPHHHDHHHHQAFKIALIRGLRAIVREASGMKHMLKGLLTAGIPKSTLYVASKLKKGLFSKGRFSSNNKRAPTSSN